MNYKLIAFDMDGTLLTSNKTMSENTIQAIHEANSHNKEIIISTGRCLPECKDVFINTPEIRYTIVGNGAYIYDNLKKEAVFSNLMDTETVDQLVKITKNRDATTQILDKECIIEKKLYDYVDQYNMEEYKKMYTDVALVVEDIESYYQKNRVPIQKINFYHKSLKEAEITLKKIIHLPLTIKNMGNIIECTAPNVNKGNAFKELCKHLNIKLEQTIAVGDSANDIDMLKCAGLSIAMNNASNEVKNICDVIVNDNDHDGCQQAIHKYLL